MKTETYLKIIKENNLLPVELATKKGELLYNLTESYMSVIRDIDNGTKSAKYYPKKWYRSKGRYTLMDEDYNRLLKVLNAYGIKYSEGNDSQRGGIEGDYILVRYDYRNSNLKNIKKSLSEVREISKK